MPLKKLGILNEGWGVCGFTSCLYGLWDVLPKNRRSQLHGGTKAHRLLAEIKTYLVMLKAENNASLIRDIEIFCRKFGDKNNDFGKFTVDGYIARVNTAVNKTEKQIKADENYGIGMPPHAVVDYLSRMWDYEAELEQGKNFGGSDNGVIGVMNESNPLSDLYGGLEHFMYRHNQMIYSWGQGFTSVTAAAKAGAGGANWKICCLIHMK